MPDKRYLTQFLTSKSFRQIFTFIALAFVVLSYFISLSPDSFLKFGYFGVFAFNVASSGLLIIPTIAKKMNLILIVIASGLGNCINTSLNYLLGASSSSMFSGNELIQKVKQFMKRFELWAVYFLAVAPLPLDVNGLLSGYLGITFSKYLVVNFLGKITIFLLVGAGVITFSK